MSIDTLLRCWLSKDPALASRAGRLSHRCPECILDQHTEGMGQGFPRGQQAAMLITGGPRCCTETLPYCAYAGRLGSLYIMHELRQGDAVLEYRKG
jgi:hypothetical protein